MATQCGIVGLPNVGKSTLFNALTKNNVLAANYPFATIEPNTGVVAVPDERLGVLAGIALLFLFQALLSLLQFVASPEALQQIVFWLFGSLARASWSKLGIVAALLAIVLPVLMADAWRLTALRLGEDRARSLGVRVERLRLRVFACISLLTAVAVCFGSMAYDTSSRAASFEPVAGGMVTG